MRRGNSTACAVGARLEPAHANLVAVFQYFIGNTDYSLQGRMRGRECCHNAKGFDVGGELLSVPYDFDYSGLVNADYAGANPIVNQTNVWQRSYLGACIERAILESSVSRLAPLQSELATLAEESGLGGGQVRRVLRYLEGPLAQSPERLVARLERACRK